MSEKTMEIPKEVIVVEGRDDTKRLIETFGPQVKTIETNGSAVDQTCLQRIQQAAAQFGVIIFTDPDYQGERIRKIVQAAVPQAKHAHLTRQQAFKSADRSLGIEHAKPYDIVQAIQSVAQIHERDDVDVVPLSFLVEVGLVAHKQSAVRRERVAAQFNLGHVNGKQLQKRLQQYGITQTQLEDFLKQEETP